MTYIFHIRPWNIEFFLALESLLLHNDPKVSILFLTMMKSCFNQLNSKRRIVHYLPDEFEKINTNSDDIIKEWDEKMNETFGFGFNYLINMERFKPDGNISNTFIKNQVLWFVQNIPNKSKLISLTCDHFVYISSGYINRLKGGHNFFIQPVGFPKQAQVITKSPFELSEIRKESLNEKYLDEYVQSLNEHPELSIHYMKPVSNPTLFWSFKKRIHDALNSPTKYSMFSYLENRKKSIIPSRFKHRKKLAITSDFLSLQDIKKLNNGQNKLFYFPLQFEPEMSILGYSPWFKNQKEVVRLISQSLKIGDLLLLKENPKMKGKREQAFYDEINKYHNVCWIDFDVNSREVIRNVFKTVSITGTATIEAAAMGKNSLIFGYPPFNDLLVEKPVSELKLSEFTRILYNHYSSEEITKKLFEGWIKFSKSVHFGNYIPSYVDGKHTIADSEKLAIQFYEDILKQN